MVFATLLLWTLIHLLCIICIFVNRYTYLPQKSCPPNRNWLSMIARKKGALYNSHSAITFNHSTD